jgi:hypothetical protein
MLAMIFRKALCEGWQVVYSQTVVKIKYKVATFRIVINVCACQTILLSSVDRCPTSSKHFIKSSCCVLLINNYDKLRQHVSYTQQNY